MRISSPDERGLLLALHQGLFDEPRWDGFLALLRQRFQANHAGIIFRAGPGHAGLSSVREFRSGNAVPEQVSRKYFEELYRFDPVPYHRLRPDRVYALSEFLDLSDSRHRSFVEEILEPAQFHYGRFVRVEEPGGAEAWCIVARHQSDFSAADTRSLGALTPHLRVALRTYAALEQARLRAVISSDVVQRLNFGWLSLDAQGVVVDMDGQAERLLQTSPVLRRVRGRLVPASPDGDRALTEILRKAAAGQSIKPRLVNVCEDPWVDMLVLSIAAEPVPARNRPVLTIYVQGDEQASTNREEHLMALFGLSANEARLALMLSRGRNFNECAEALGLTLESIRTYSKRVYAKTGTRGQADLVRLILASVIALA